MRIGIVHGWGWKVGGVEIYLEELILKLREMDHEIVIGYVQTSAESNKTSYWPDDVDAYELSRPGPSGLDGFLDWDPNLIYIHILLDLGIWDRLLGHCSPSIYFAHSFMSTCVSGSKCFRFPRSEVCTRKLGPGCLIHYLPRRCGGLNPVTMLKQFMHQSALLKRVRSCSLVLTHSMHMQEELSRHVGVSKVRRIRFCLPTQPKAKFNQLGTQCRKSFNLLFMGRMETEKGGDYLLRALPMIRLGEQKDITVVFAGEGTKLGSWRLLASKIEENNPWISVSFLGWKEGSQKEQILSRADVFIMPALWPEPLGMAPLEALSHGIPVAGFRRGGFSEHIVDGVNGSLAPDPISEQGLAKAIEDCILSSSIHGELGLSGRPRLASVSGHTSELLTVFNRVLLGVEKC